MDEGKRQEKNLRYRLIIPVSSSFFSSSSVSILFFSLGFSGCRARTTLQNNHAEMVVHKVLRQLILLAQRPEGERTSRNVLKATDVFPETYKHFLGEKNVYFLLPIYYYLFFVIL